MYSVEPVATWLGTATQIHSHAMSITWLNMFRYVVYTCIYEPAALANTFAKPYHAALLVFIPCSQATASACALTAVACL